jgi:2-dehydro-3-deoxygluconokinase
VQVAVTDLVGAGDAFAAGYLSALLDGEPPAQRLERGHTCAAFVVSTNGDWEGAPHRSELDLVNTLTLKEVRR